MYSYEKVKSCASFGTFLKFTLFSWCRPIVKRVESLGLKYETFITSTCALTFFFLS